MPEHLCSDNGPEFIAYAIQDWLKEKQVKTIYITSGSPWEDAYIESFHDKLRAECLNQEFLEARVAIASSGTWNTVAQRPHSSLGYQTPNEFAGRAAILRHFGRASRNEINNIKPMAELCF